MGKLIEVKTGREVSARLTTEHAASSYGVPVLVLLEDGTALGPGEIGGWTVIPDNPEEAGRLQRAGYNVEDRAGEGTVRVWIYMEHSRHGGRVCQDPRRIETAAAGETDDVFLYADSEAAAIQRARVQLQVRQDQRPGGAGDAFDWRCARNVLRHFGVDVEGGAE